jgi:Family of unknown function (DUF5677)
MKLGPKKADPINAAHRVDYVLSKTKPIGKAFWERNQKEKAFADWRQHQIMSFITYLAFYTDDLRYGFANDRLHLIAQAMRNLMELRVWVEFCRKDETDAKRFFDDAARDLRDVMQATQKLYSHVNKNPEKKLDAWIADLRAKAPNFQISDIDAKYFDVKDAAEKLGFKEAHSRIFKAASKFTHPTALLFATRPRFGDMEDSLFDIGSNLANLILSEVEKSIKAKYADFVY